MPVQRKTKKRKYVKAYSRTVNVARPIRGAMPSRLSTQLVYFEQVNMPSAITSDYVFKANGMYDPNLTGVGHQPRGFDEIMALYDHFYVTAASIRVAFTNTATAVGDEGVVSISASDGSGTASTLTDALESNTVVWSVVGVSGQSKQKILSLGPLTTRQQVSITDESSLKGSSSADPSELWFYHLVAHRHDGGTVSMVADVQITYFVTFLEPKMPGQS